MDPDELSGYENEPEDLFTPVPEERYPELYHLHTVGSVEESNYFRNLLTASGARHVLELGCGTGRISEALHGDGFAIVSIDISRPMLNYQKSSRQVPVVEMDMCTLGFGCLFDAVIIPCNSLNLLLEETLIRGCLQGIRRILAPQAILIVELFVPNEPLLASNAGRLFQFQSCNLTEPGKLVKESIRLYDPGSQTLELEERYKIRPYNKTSLRENYSRNFRLAAFPANRWFDIMTDVGFSITSQHGSFSGQRFQPGHHSTLLLAVQPST